ncbi:helix-turn-helix domain-containing protein [Streptomyces sp. DSM 44915]|uniref:Helix-turn-helix domain-containing protein n=1 Tax=Streptomyces chisholmiae TaxID=3075540 RepID=A0ABU2JYF8_9ACTN|nr:helix-turn-helix domain-containing protein [Streptomyces sp. DSM 44915]MDT0269769.1 helix-turn-helix domain-containing protein [Streptomyces sp. DSM 44915]
MNARSRRTREAILAATRALLEERGPAALTMAAVAERVGLSRRGLYLHFTSRSELVTALFDYLADREGLTPSLQPVWAAPDSVTALAEWARHLARYHPRVLAVDQALRQVGERDPDARAHCARADAAQLANCRRLAEWLAREGRLAAPWTEETAARLLWSLVSSELIGRLLGEQGWSQDELAVRLALLQQRTLVAGATG